MEIVLSAIAAGGLVGASDQYMCLLIVGITSRLGWITLTPALSFMGSWWFIAIVVVFWLLTVVPAYASLVTIENCPTCYGSVYALTVTPTTGSDPLLAYYTATLSIDATHFTPPDGKDARYISAVGFKVANDVLSAELVSTSFVGSGWSTASEANLSNGGCAGGATGSCVAKASWRSGAIPLPGHGTSPLRRAPCSRSWPVPISARSTPTPPAP